MNKEIAKFHEIAENLDLKFIIQEPILPTEPVLAIIHTRSGTDSKSPPLPKRTLTITSRNKFAEEQGFIWTDAVLPRDLNNSLVVKRMEYKARPDIERTKKCEKALLQTDYGFATVNLTLIQKDEPVIIYEGELITETMTMKIISSTSLIENKKAAPIRDRDLYLYYDEESKELLTVNAEKKRGFGSFMQSLMDTDKLKYYQFTKENQQKVAFANLQKINDYLFPVYRALENIPPLSLLGFSYEPDFFITAQIPCVPFNKMDGFSLPYEVAHYHLGIFEKNVLSDDKQPLNKEYILSQEELNNCIQYIAEKKAIKFGPFYLKESEAKLIKEWVSKKFTHLVIEINTPDILHMLQAVVYSFRFHPSFLNIFDQPAKLAAEQIDIQSNVFSTFTRIDCIAKKEAVDFKNSGLPDWFKFLSHQHLYFGSLNKLFDIILQSYNTNTNQESKQQRMKNLIHKYGNKEKFPSAQYPVTFRNAAANLDIAGLWFLLKENGARSYINHYSPTTKKTALHVAVESKKQNGDKLTTCLLLLQSQADPTLKDNNNKTPRELSNTNPVLTFLFKRVQITASDLDQIGEKIEEEAAKQGFGESLR